MAFTKGTIVMTDAYGAIRDDIASNLGYTYATLKSKFKDGVGYFESKGMSQAEVLSLYEFEIAWNDAFWKTWGYFTENPSYGDIRSRGSIVAPDGAFRVKFGCLFGYGRYQGQGSNVYFVLNEPGAKNVGSTAGTAIVIDHAGWMTKYAPERIALRSCSWGLDTGNAYMEGTVIDGFRFVGGRDNLEYDSTFTSYGLGMWDSGEASSVSHCYGHGFNNAAFCFPKGTPSFIYACSGFSNCKNALDIQGNNGLSTTTITHFSGDDNDCLINVSAMAGGVAGGTIIINGIKSETGKRTPLRKQTVFRGRGALNVVINGISADSQNGTSDQAIDIDFGTFNGQVVVNGLRTNGYTNWLKWTKAGKSVNYASPGNVTPGSFAMNETGILSATRILNGTDGSSTPTTPTNPTTPTSPPSTTETQLVRTAWKASANPNPAGTPASNVLDGNTGSRYATGRAQRVGDYLQIDMGASVSLSRVVMDAGTSYYDCPLGYKLEVSTNGTTWTQVATGTGNPANNQPISIPFTKTTARYFRISVTAAQASAWWSVMEVNAYVSQ